MTFDQAQELILLSGQISEFLYTAAQVICVICGVLLFAVVQDAFKL
jgi:hypothetical protein